MSVLIKGMNLPENCGDCPFCIFSADEKRWIGYCNTSDEDYYCKALDRFMEYDEVDGGVDILGKPNDCPLVEVPTPHGRLIDADELQEKFDLAQKSLEQHGQEFSDAFMSTSQEISTEWWAVEQKLDDAKTVIESEE